VEDLKRTVRGLAKLGFRPLPVKPGEKHPYIAWTKYRDSYSPLQLVSEWQPGRGLWTILGGLVGWIVLDCDNDAALVLWQERLGDRLAATARVKTRKGYHYYWKVAVGTTVQGWTWKSDPEAVERDAHYELLADGQGVIMPPSRHAEDNSFVYEWQRTPETASDAPEILLTRPEAAGDKGKGQKNGKAGTAKTGRSLLAHLLLNRPSGENSGRNDWHATVAGHLVKMMPYADAYDALALTLNDALDAPLPAEEVLKTWQYRWAAEMTDRQSEIGSAESGWLSGDGTELFTVIRRPVGKDQYVLDSAPWANADITCTGFIDSETNGRTYVVRVQRRDGLVRPDLITPGILGSANDTNKWLARHGVSVLTPKYDEGGKSGHVGQRLLRYLEWQKPDAYRAVSYLGWHAQFGFVTHEGVLTAAGMKPHEGVMPDPLLRDLAPYHYGMGDPDEARQVLREVLTFQDSTVTAVFGAWWCATLLKGHIIDTWGHFPYFMINAASEAGKTRGFFRLMLNLSGSKQYGIGTKASTRDYIGAHRNGIVHIDDPDNVDQLGELLRAAAGEATLSKKGGDNRTTVEIKMVAPVLLSGESLGLGDEKAHRDRSVRVDVPSPVGRMSLHDPTRPQIDDIKDLERAHPDLSEFAGAIVHLVLQREKMLRDLPVLRGPAGRHNEIKAIVRLGARVLADILHEPGEKDGDPPVYDASWLVETVDRWARAQQDMGAANTLVTRVLPWALNHEEWRHRDSPIYNPPVYIDKYGQIWVDAAKLGAEWRKEMARQRVNDRLSTDEAIVAQLRAIGITTSKAKWIVPRNGREQADAQRSRYWPIPLEYNTLIMGSKPEVETREEP
jgi:hypothetical protein